MCLFNGKVSEVSKTRIFVSPVQEETSSHTTPNKQLTVYSNAVKAKILGSNDDTTFAMVLPFPVPARLRDSVPSSQSHLYEANLDVIQLVNLKSFEDRFGKFFDVVDNAFPKVVSDSDLYLSSSSRSWSAPLQVVQIGDYKVSVARTLPDLKRVDASEFKLTSNLDQVLEKHYGEGFGFVVCAFNPTHKVDTNNQKSHPIAYISHTRPEGSLFIPTRHEHGKPSSSKEHWDHQIYSLNTTSYLSKNFAYNASEDVVKVDPFTTTQRKILNGLLGSCAIPSAQLLTRLTVNGQFKNEDLALKVSA